MKKHFLGAAALAVLALSSAPAFAGVYADDLTKCLVKNTSADDQLALVRWSFAMMALHPAIKDMANIPPAARDQMNKQAIDITERLITVDCRAETVDALKYEGPGIFRTSFEVLGQVAFRGLTNEPQVSQGFVDWAKGFNLEKIIALGKEAGLPSPPPK